MSSARQFHASVAITRCRKFAVAGALGAWLALLAGLVGRWAWPLDLFAHFRVQYAVLFVVFAIVLALLERRAVAILSVAGALVSVLPLARYVSLPTKSAEARAGNFRLVSFNVWFRNDDLERIAEYLESTHADVIVLQELSRLRALELQPLLPSYPHSYLEAGRRRGAVIFTRWPMVKAEEVALSGEGVRAARVALRWHDATVTVLGVHLHWPLGARNSRLRNEELQGLASLTRSHQGPLLVAGDFNVTPWSVHFQNALSRSALNDSAAAFGILPTWPSQFPPLGIRIDHCLTSHQWRSVDVGTGPYVGSDHRPLVVDLQLRE